MIEHPTPIHTTSSAGRENSSLTLTVCWFISNSHGALNMQSKNRESIVDSIDYPVRQNGCCTRPQT